MAAIEDLCSKNVEVDPKADFVQTVTDFDYGPRIERTGDWEQVIVWWSKAGLSIYLAFTGDCETDTLEDRHFLAADLECSRVLGRLVDDCNTDTLDNKFGARSLGSKSILSKCRQAGRRRDSHN